MIPFEQAIRNIETVISPLTTENISFRQVLNRVLAAEVISDADMPPFNKAAMDGYACRKADLDDELEIIEEIPAGKKPKKEIGQKQCSRIMTGAMVPDGADFILMKEHAVVSSPGKVRQHVKSSHENICYKGEDLKAGDVVLNRGTRLLPAHIAILAAMGCTAPSVYKTPGIAVISTGNELVEPMQMPDSGKIRNSNGYQLVAQVARMGLSADYLGIIADDECALQAKLAEAIKKYDVVLISGGVSVGDYDYVPKVLAKLEVELLFHGMNVKPGKHFLLGRKDGCFVAGMPGNPVSSFVLFEVLVKPLLNRLMGNSEKPEQLILPIEKTYTRKKSDMLFFIPVTLTEKGTALPLEYHGSAHIHAYTKAKGIMEVPVGINEYKKGDLVHVRPL